MVTYDRRGYTRSKIDDLAQELRLETESDDIHHLLTALATEPAFVLGSSIGAVIALDFAARYPDQVRTVVAHEPPASYLTLQKTASQQSTMKYIHEILKNEGSVAAMKEFASRVGVNNIDTTAAHGTKSDSNIKFFIQKEFPMLAKYRFDFNQLKTAMTKTRIVIGGGLRSSRDSIGYLGAVAVSELLGITIVEFPGDHAVTANSPKEFSERLCNVITNNNLGGLVKRAIIVLGSDPILRAGITDEGQTKRISVYH